MLFDKCLSDFQIIPITPQQTIADNANLPTNPLIRWYRKFHEVSRFEQLRRNFKTDTKWAGLEANDATKLWIVKRVFETSHQLPSILNFTPVVNELGSEPFNPVQCAILEMQKTNNALLETAQMVAAGSTELLISLGGKIRGILQADVGGGIRNYEVRDFPSIGFLLDSIFEESGVRLQPIRVESDRGVEAQANGAPGLCRVRLARARLPPNPGQ